MKLAFIFDTVLLEDDNKNFFAINLSYKLWEDRYLPIFENIVVSTRVKKEPREEINKKKGYLMVNGNHVEVKPISNYKIVTDIFIKRKKIISQIRKIISDCDKVIIRMPSPLSSLACDICRAENKDYAIEMVADPWDGYWNHTKISGKIVAPYMLYKTKIQCRKAKRVLYVTNKFLQNRYPTKGKTTNVSNVLINEASDEVLQKRINKIKNMKDSCTLGLVGNLNLKSKGHIVAFKALKKIKNKASEIKLELIGPGDPKYLMNEAKKYGLENNIIFRGTIPSGDAVLKWMDNIDILLIPSFQEGLPRVLIEAMSRGCPAIGSTAGGIPELINNQLLHKPGKYKKLAKDISNTINNKELLINLAVDNFNNAKAYTKEKLDKKRKKFWLDFKNNIH